MIDYCKLKDAVTLCSKLSEHYFTIEFCTNLTNHDCLGIWLHEVGTGKKQHMLDLDELLINLREKAYPKSKFKVGQQVWHLNSDLELESFIITTIDHDSDEKYYSSENDEWWIEEQLHAKPCDIIYDQLRYWHKMQDEHCSKDMAPEFEGEIKGFNGKNPTIEESCKAFEERKRKFSEEQEARVAGVLIRIIRGELNK